MTRQLFPIDEQSSKAKVGNTLKITILRGPQPLSWVTIDTFYCTLNPNFGDRGNLLPSFSDFKLLLLWKNGKRVTKHLFYKKKFTELDAFTMTKSFTQNIWFYSATEKMPIESWESKYSGGLNTEHVRIWVVSIDLFWVFFMPFSYNGVYLQAPTLSLPHTHFECPRYSFMLKCNVPLSHNSHFLMVISSYMNVCGKGLTQNIFAPKLLFPPKKFVSCAQRGKESEWNLLPYPKKCYFHSPLNSFWLTMTSQIESFRGAQYTPLY